MSNPDFARMRAAMVDSQLRPNGVTRPSVVAAFRAVPREAFVPHEAAPLAYLDEDIPLGHGRFLLEPLTLGRLLNDLGVVEGERVLIVGGATGYSAALLIEMGARVTVLETGPDMVEHARRALGDADAELVSGELAKGHAEGAPYDVILIEGLIPEFPPALVAQLREGGRAAAVIADEETGAPRAGIGRKAGGVLGWTFFTEAYVPALPGFARAPAFSF